MTKEEISKLDVGDLYLPTDGRNYPVRVTPEDIHAWNHGARYGQVLPDGYLLKYWADLAFENWKGRNMHFWTLGPNDDEVLLWKQIWILGHNDSKGLLKEQLTQTMNKELKDGYVNARSKVIEIIEKS